MSYQVGVDIGGTFTDCVAIDPGGNLVIAKAPTTPKDFNQGFFEGLAILAKKLGRELPGFVAEVDTMVLSTTIATNIMIELQGAKTGLITTRGHKDGLLMQRGMGRTAGLPVEQLFAVTTTRKPEPLVDYNMIVEVDERIDYAGRVVVPLQEAQVEDAVRQLVGRGCQAIAVAFLWSFKNPQHELAAKEIVQGIAPHLFVTSSHEVSPRMGEYERYSASVINAYIGPKVSQYLSECENKLHAMGYNSNLLIMQCGGGAVSVGQAQVVPLMTLDSGPVAGITASQFLARKLNHSHVIATDMGGTSFDVGIIADGKTSVKNVNVINQFHYTIPKVDIESIGSGGGSTAWVDSASGSLRVGPQSAGAFPGPACYGRGGTHATVTDANVFLGYIRDGATFGESITVSRALAAQVLTELGHQLNLSATEAAQGILTISNARMADLLHRETIARGYDPRDFVIFSYGGAGPLHAGSYARALGAQRVVVPGGDTASVWSAFGAAFADFKEITERELLLTVPFDHEAVNQAFDELESKAGAVVHKQGIAADDLVFDNYGKFRYQGQTHEVEVSLPEDGLSSSDAVSAWVQRFEDSYARLYGHGAQVLGVGIELVSVRSEAVGNRNLALGGIDGAHKSSADARLKAREVYWQEHQRFVVTDVFDGLQIGPGVDFEGPCIVELPDTGIVVHPGQSFHRDPLGNFILTL